MSWEDVITTTDTINWQQLSWLLDAIPAPLLLKAPNGMILAANLACEQFSGKSRQTLVGQYTPDVTASTIAETLEHYDAAVRSEGAVQVFEIQSPNSKGETRHIAHRRGPLRVPGAEGLGIVALFVDVTDEVQEKESLRAREKRLVEAIQAAADSCWSWDPKQRKVAVTLGWLQADGTATTCDMDDDVWMCSVHPEEQDTLKTALQACAAGTQPRFEILIRRAQNQRDWRWQRIRGMSFQETDGSIRVVGVETDVHLHVESEARLQHLQWHDALTGLPNRAQLLAHLQQLADLYPHAPERAGALLIIEIDRMHIIHESLGIEAEDAVIDEVAKRLIACARPKDVLCRVGANEFALLMDGVATTASTQQIAQRLQSQASGAFAASIANTVVPVPISLSIAISLLAGYHNPVDALRETQASLRRMRYLGRSHVVVSVGEVVAGATRLLQIERDLVGAIERGEMKVYYQPIIRLSTGQIDGFEALLRWDHPVLGRCNPAEFIPIAEDTGHIVELGQWVFDEAVRQSQEWHLQFPHRTLSMSINLSARQLRDASFLKHYDKFFNEVPFRPNSLALEITETALIENSESVGPVLDLLNARGAILSLDDFGTGFSSLSYIVKLPIGQIKVDRSFVSKVCDGGREAIVTRTILQLGEALGLPVTAEGVETQEQLEWLRANNCARAQGYLFSRPIDAKAATQLLQEKQNW